MKSTKGNSIYQTLLFDLKYLDSINSIGHQKYTSWFFSYLLANELNNSSLTFHRM